MLQRLDMHMRWCIMQAFKRLPGIHMVVMHKPPLIRQPNRLVTAAQRLALLLTAYPVSALAQAPSTDPAAFQVSLWAASCMACHGPDGRAEGAGMAIGGRPDLLRKLLAYKSGQLPATIMHQHAKGYSDDELGRIAEYFSRLK
jgi:cytochrome c553